ncbi:hypothetical protein D3C80_1984490 [compost metagenome]
MNHFTDLPVDLQVGFAIKVIQAPVISNAVAQRDFAGIRPQVRLPQALLTPRQVNL